MSLKTADRVYETSITTGTGTYTLDGAATGFQPFSTIGASNQCWYFATDDTNWEVGIGTYLSAPSRLQRDTILASSNGGSAVNWSSGTRKIRLGLPAEFGAPKAETRTSDTALGQADYGKTIVATGTWTQTLTAAATLGDRWAANLRNDGTGVWTIDPNGSETIDGQTTLVLGPGASCVLVCDGTNFKTVGLGAWVRIGRATASSSSSIDFTAGINASADLYALHYHDVVPGTDNVDLTVRVSQDAGSTWKAGASDYRFGRYGFTDGAAAANSGSTGASAIVAQYALGGATGEAASGVIYLARPSTSSGYKVITAFGGLYGQAPAINGNVIAGAMLLNESAINGLRVLTSSGNIARGEFELLALRKG